jgi:hypothetical protein
MTINIIKLVIFSIFVLSCILYKRHFWGKIVQPLALGIMVFYCGYVLSFTDESIRGIAIRRYKDFGADTPGYEYSSAVYKIFGFLLFALAFWLFYKFLKSLNGTENKKNKR